MRQPGALLQARLCRRDDDRLFSYVYIYISSRAALASYPRCIASTAAKVSYTRSVGAQGRTARRARRCGRHRRPAACL